MSRSTRSSASRSRTAPRAPGTGAWPGNGAPEADPQEAGDLRGEQRYVVRRGISGLPKREDIENVVVIGMGGSGIAGDVLQAVASPLLPVPVTVVKHYECPHFVNESSLVFAVSCSGRTEETIEAATDAALAGAKLVVVTSGGELANWPKRGGRP